MRTTVKLDPEVAKAVEELKRREGLGVSEALNKIARRGLAAGERDKHEFVQRVSAMGEPRIPLDDIGAALEVLEGEGHKG